MRNQRLADIDPEEERRRGARSVEEDEKTVEEVLLAHLKPLIEDKLIDEVIRPIKSGKEAVVYCCRANESLGGGLIAAKIYRPVERRSFKNDAVYQQGRERGARPDARTLRALGKKTKRGRLHKFSAWIAHEMRTMTLLHQANADVPEPIERQGPVILMQYFGDEHAPAPVLVNVKLDADEVATIYQQGRERGARPDARTLRALGKKTKRGRLHKFSAWIAHEMRTMTLLHQANADVPEPIERMGPVILMQYFGDEHAPAPVLVNVKLDADEVATIYQQILRNVELFLVQHRVHADLSAYNMLYVDDHVVIIDFPQSVDPRYNDDAFDLLVRDLKNVNAFFKDYELEVVDPFYHTLDLWRKHVDAMR